MSQLFIFERFKKEQIYNLGFNKDNFADPRTIVRSLDSITIAQNSHKTIFKHWDSLNNIINSLGSQDQTVPE